MFVGTLKTGVLGGWFGLVFFGQLACFFLCVCLFVLSSLLFFGGVGVFSCQHPPVGVFFGGLVKLQQPPKDTPTRWMLCL